MPNASKVSTGKPKISGAIYRAPLGTTLPTDATTALDAAFKELGHVSEDGVSNSQDLSVSEIKAWGGVIVYRSNDGFSDQFSLALIESENWSLNPSFDLYTITPPQALISDTLKS